MIKIHNLKSIRFSITNIQNYFYVYDFGRQYPANKNQVKHSLNCEL